MRIFLLLLCVLAGGGAIYWFYLSPDAVRERAVVRMIAEMDYAANSNSRYKVGTFLDRFLLSDARVSLEVNTMVSGPFPPRPAMKQKFNKDMLLQFTDHVLSPLQLFQGEAVLKNYAPGKTKDTAKFRVRILNQAEGNTYQRRDMIYTSFTTDTTCVMVVNFVDEAGYISPKLIDADCIASLSLAPKGSYSKADELKKKLRDSLETM